MKIEEIIFWLLFLVGLFIIFWYTFGKSPTIEQALLIFILAMVIKNAINIKGIKSDFKYFRNGFTSLADDFKQHIKYK